MVYQTTLCTSGSLKGVLAASHYNRSWSLHSFFSEALERLPMTRFTNEKKPSISAALKDYCLGSISFPANEVVTKSAKLLKDYERYRDEVANGSIGKTAQFWMIYLNFMRIQSFGQLAVHQNDIKSLICVWKVIIPFYVAMNKTNYPRYSVFQILFLKL